MAGVSSSSSASDSTNPNGHSSWLKRSYWDGMDVGADRRLRGSAARAPILLGDGCGEGLWRLLGIGRCLVGGVGGVSTEGDGGGGVVGRVSGTSDGTWEVGGREHLGHFQPHLTANFRDTKPAHLAWAHVWQLSQSTHVYLVEKRKTQMAQGWGSSVVLIVGDTSWGLGWSSANGV
jgi:hypothetical protein